MDNYYQIYINKVIELAKTIVIKSESTVEALNRFVTDYHGPSAVDSSDPLSWKYYRNISGEYHFTDEEMKVVSIDTLEIIIFTKSNLMIHKGTARAYEYGTRQYIELVNKYPEQEMLILGILYPVDINKAIAAKDYSILTYPKNLVESNEYSLIYNLQAWIDKYMGRWFNPQYTMTDELYSATALGIMYLNLIPAILNLRLEACKTNEAHSFHVTQYLASHGLLDTYVDKLTIKQRLFFYRNISYIERNLGKKYIFDWLVENIATERRIPMAEYLMRHKETDQLSSIYPEPRFFKKAINGIESSNQITNISLQELLDKQDPLAKSNYLYRTEFEDIIDSTMKNSKSNIVATKVLESSMIDYSNSSPHTLTDTLLNHWVALSTDNSYRTNIVVTNPKTGEPITLNAKEAYTFAWFAFAKSIGIELDTIPQMFAKRIQNI